ncbi:MAG: A/G-specific adenine glycosylase [Anaerolineales bacterium]|nr:A/G-specific adenine glycosylase [Anaerolineales bacterium]
MTLPLAAPLLAWYAAHARQLPWRGENNPYKVWVAEVMLQQTQVETVKPYYQRWMERFPTLRALAEASQQEVLAAWEGLGYYGRARKLHQAAQVVMCEHGGRIPEEVERLARLPGVGRYTAGAIASIAFGKDAAAVDGNQRRVLARVFNLEEPLNTPAGERRLWELAEAHLPKSQAGAFNQALMDLGAMVCTQRAPACGLCPLAEFCQARRLGVQEGRPVRRGKAPTPRYQVAAAVIRREGRVLITQRPADKLLGGMWEFPGGKQQEGEDLAGCLQRELMEELGVGVRIGAPFGVYRHAYTHFRVTVHAFTCELSNGMQPLPLEAQAMRWCLPEELGGYPMGKVDRQIAQRCLLECNPLL